MEINQLCAYLQESQHRNWSISSNARPAFLKRTSHLSSCCIVAFCREFSFEHHFTVDYISPLNVLGEKEGKEKNANYLEKSSTRIQFLTGIKRYQSSVSRYTVKEVK